jgi:group II intron reverse transcriptase/maturase
MEPLEGKMTGMSEPATVSTKRQRIAKLAREAPDMVLTTLAHHIDMDWLREAFRLTRKDGAPGVDGVTAQEYEANLEDNLRSLLERAKSGTYRAPPVRRVHIPKGDGGKTRPIGLPSFEDKVLQRAVVMVLESVYEEEFYSFSFGFRPGRSAHQALEHLRAGTMKMQGGWVLEVDIRHFFDALDHRCLREILHERVRDGVLLRLIGKWLKAGVLEEGRHQRSEAGTPQGGVISPLLANIYLHTVFDRWYANTVISRIRGRTAVARYADDIVLVFEREEDARRVMRVLPKRFGKYGLALHPDKTRLVPFRQPGRGPRGPNDPGKGSGSFDFLGFTLFWGRSRRGNWVVKWKTAKSRLSRAITAIRQWCRTWRHRPVDEQHRMLSAKLRGHYAYFGVTFNSRSLWLVFREAQCAWRKWLSRRSRKARISWEKFQGFPSLPRPRIVHSYTRNAAKP